MRKGGSGFSRLGVLAPAALSACIDVSVLAAPAAGAILSTVLKELSKAFMLKKWFYGMMSVQEAELLLMQKGKNGSYLVRESQSHPGEYVLSVRVRDRVSHVKIRREHNKYNVGSGEVFDDLSELIQHCRAYPLTEASGVALRLTQPVNGGCTKARNKAKASLEAQVMEPEDPGNLFEGNKYNAKIAALLKPDTPTNGFYGIFVDGSLEDEFQSVKNTDKTNTFTKIQGHLQRNAYKNRFRNVIPYDQTRVFLPREFFSLDEFYSDYINASYIRPSWMFKKFLLGDMDFVTAPNEAMPLPPLAERGLYAEALKELDRFRVHPNNPLKVEIVKDKFYIATQGCLWSTSHSFWSMIFHKDIRVIAMVTNKIENGQKKCHGYWPAVGGAVIHGDIIVWTVQEYYHSHYTIREIQLTSSVTCEQKTVYHYMFMDWFDTSVPMDTKGILSFVRDINQRMVFVAQGSDAPRHNILCVHCTAGIGRTGTFIAIDMLIDIVKAEGNMTSMISQSKRSLSVNAHIDVYNIVKLIRTQRAGMVQNQDQYEFIYHAVLDYLEQVKAQNARAAGR